VGAETSTNTLKFKGYFGSGFGWQSFRGGTSYGVFDRTREKASNIIGGSSLKNRQFTELPSITFIITELPPIKLGPSLPLQRPIESCAMGLAAIDNYILLSVLIFIADLCVAAAYEAILLMHATRLARDSLGHRLLVANFQRSCH
jgi:hypothetical protein